jgi:hypothetical protein
MRGTEPEAIRKPLVPSRLSSESKHPTDDRTVLHDVKNKVAIQPPLLTPTGLSSDTSGMPARDPDLSMVRDADIERENPAMWNVIKSWFACPSCLPSF